MATYYISPTGNDTTGDGSEGSPWRNLSYAISSSGIDDTILIESGTYLAIQNYFGGIGERTIKSVTGSAFDVIIDFQNVFVKGFGAGNQSLIEGITFINVISNQGNAQPFRNFNGKVVNCIFDTCTGTDGGFFASVFASSSTEFERTLFVDCHMNNSNGTTSLIGSNGVNLTCSLDNCVIYYRDKVLPAGIKYPTHIFMSNGNPDATYNVKNTTVYCENSSLLRGYDATQGNVTVNTTYSCLHNVDYTGSETGVITEDPKFVDPDNNFYDFALDSPCIGLSDI